MVVTLQIFDGNILTDDHCLSQYTCKCCTIFKQFDRLNFDGLAGKHQKHQNFPQSKFSAIRYVPDEITTYVTVLHPFF